MVATPTTTALLHAHQLSGGPGNSLVIDRLSFSWPAGLSWIGGDEGSGKTTLLRLLAGDLTPHSGSVQAVQGGVFGILVPTAQQNELTIQGFWDTQRLHWPQWHEPWLHNLAEALDLQSHQHKRLNMLSTGSRRKVLLAAALASGATVTLLDQPFAALDLKSIQVVKAVFQEATQHPSRAWIVADYEAPISGALASVLNLDAIIPSA